MTFAKYVALIAASSIMLYPLVFMILGSLMTMEQYTHVTVLPLPNPITLQHYINFFARLGADLWPALRITTLRVAWYVAIALLTSLFGGYAFSRLRFHGKNLLFMFW
mgnify:CR=1 FL=1